MLHALCTSGSIRIITSSPGTGKTHLIIALIKVMLTLNYKVLLCAPSNDSTNHLASAIHHKYPELEVIRVYRLTAEEQQIKGEMSDREERYTNTKEDVHIFSTIDAISTLAQMQRDKRGRVAHKHLCLILYCIQRMIQI